MVTDSAGSVEVLHNLSRPYPDDQGTGKAPTVVGVKRPISDSEARQIAVQFMLENSGLFVPRALMGDLRAEDLAVGEVISNTYPAEYASRGTDFTVIFSQVYKGIPVFEATSRLSLTQYGEIWSVKNGFAALNNPPTSPQIDEVGALLSARYALADPTANPQKAPALMILAPSKLVWRLNFLLPHFQEILVDAITGEIALMRKNVRDQTPRVLTEGTVGKVHMGATR